jgi:hypothetical protein
VKVKVVDTLGNPVAKAHVQLSDISGYASVSRYTLISGQPSAVVSMSANAPTDLNGIAYIKTLHLDSATTGSVVVTPATGSALSWKSEKTEIGAGSAITVILARPTVTLSGKVSLSDGTPVAPYTVSFSDGRGGDQGSAKVDATTGTYSMQVPVGIKGAFYLSCPAAEMQIALSPFCMSFYGGSRTITANTVVDITIPTEKTRIHVTDPNGIGLSNVSLLIYHSVGMGTCTQATASIFADYPTVATAARSRVITDADGWAFATTLKLNAECEAWVELTPPATSRYQSRTVKMTVSNNADNLIVLTIPSPSISNGALTSNANGRVVTLIGDNFLGTTSVTWNGINISSFVVDSANQLRLLLPTLAASTGEAIVSNGGGIASFSLN